MRKSFCFLSFALVLSLAVSGAYAAVWYSQNFNNLASGDMAGQDGWDIITEDMATGITSPVVQSAVVHGTSGKALKVEAAQELMRHFDPMHTGEQFLIIHFRKEDASSDNTLHIYLGKDTHEWRAGPVIRIGSQSGGDPDKVGIHNGDNRVPAATFVPGQWHKIRLVANYNTLTYDVYFDDALVADDFNFRNTAHNALGWLMIGFDAGVGVLGYYDNIILGDGDGADVTAVHPESKLATTWAALKR